MISKFWLDIMSGHSLYGQTLSGFVWKMSNDRPLFWALKLVILMIYRFFLKNKAN